MLVIIDGLVFGFGCSLLLKVEIGDHALAGRKKALAQSLSKSLLMFETCQNSQCSLVIPIIPVCLFHSYVPNT